MQRTCTTTLASLLNFFGPFALYNKEVYNEFNEYKFNTKQLDSRNKQIGFIRKKKTKQELESTNCCLAQIKSAR